MIKIKKFFALTLVGMLLFLSGCTPFLFRAEGQGPLAEVEKTVCRNAAEENERANEGVEEGEKEKSRISDTSEKIPAPHEHKESLEQAAPLNPAELIEREFAWSYGGKRWSYQLEVPVEVYTYYAGLERLPMTNHAVFSVYVNEPLQQPFISAIAARFSEAAARAGYSLKQTIELVLAFVQSLEYVSDDISTGFDQYTRYPLETLVDQAGDCKDTSILFAAIVKEMGIDVVLVLLPGTNDEPGHMAVGVRGKDLPGSYYEYKGGRYYYVETTATGWAIGQIPTELRNRQAIIVPLDPQPVLTHTWEARTTHRGQLEIVVTVNNYGNATARNTGVYAYLEANGDRAYDQTWSGQLNLEPYTKGIYTLYLQPPRGGQTRLHVNIISGNYLVDKSSSDWFQT